MKSNLKSLIISCCPKSVLIKIKFYHYYKKLKKSTEDTEEDLKLLKHFIKDNSHNIDIGANFGLYSKFMSKYSGQKGKVLSIEPIPETFGHLKNNIQKLKYFNVTPLNIAISDRSGKVFMEVPKYTDNRENFYEAKITDVKNNSNSHFEIESNTIDNICKDYFFNPGFIKCDVEGHEWFVIKGAQKVIDTYKPVLLIEINQNLTEADSNTLNLINNLKEKGYKIYINENNKLILWTIEKKFNYFFLTDEHVKLLD